ncbi:MAG TPA: phenylacetate--CoA ligase family protein [Thermoanaerobaculia bacterium]|nr:phenylacetate--CoA ligase family protein [Thermoanaerobaculia bacterium]
MSELERARRDRLRRVLRAILAGNRFYRAKLAARPGLAELDPESFELADLGRLPLTTKEELVADQREHPPFGSNLSLPLERFVRMHQTSGTQGHPLRWLDTAESWDELIASWSLVYDAVGVTPEDRVFVAFSFGPFIGFWGAFEAAQRRGSLTLTGGALSTAQRLEQILELEATVVVSTPTYALHLLEAARRAGENLRASAVRATVHAGEPGASVRAVRARLEEGWGARCFDHAGATELGAWGYPGPDGVLHLDEERFLAELVDPVSGTPIAPGPEGARGELVLTSLGRVGSPLLRYRTGDLVELVPRAAGKPTALRGGVLGRIDDMFVVRGVNVYPSAIENVVREIPEITEFRATVRPADGLTELELEVEIAPDCAHDPAAALASLLHRRLALRVPVSTVEPGTLPRWELKARRFRFLEAPR